MQTDTAVVLLKHQSLVLGEINSELMVLHVLGETGVLPEGSEVAEKELRGAGTLEVKLQ